MIDDDLYNKLLILEQQFKQDSITSLGYPCNRGFDYESLIPFLKFHINNAGDPYYDSRCKVHTHHQEIEVIEYFINLMGGNTIEHWGYITNGSTEGNLQGLYMARETYIHSHVYYSEDSHYSIPKNIKILGMTGRKVKSNSCGQMDAKHLVSMLGRGKDEFVPIIVINVGTTMKGAIDNLTTIKKELEDAGIQRYYLHVDAAFFGMILPFIDNDVEYNFTHGIDSIAISGQKFIGSPFPTGVLLTKKEHVRKITSFIDYVNSYDTTITGSRNGLSALILWAGIQTKDFKKDVEYTLDLADYAYGKLNKLFPVHKEPYSPIIWWTEKLNEDILEKWQIAGNDIAHIVINSHMTRNIIDDFIADIEDFHF